jgi:hypothetical protein
LAEELRGVARAVGEARRSRPRDGPHHAGGRDAPDALVAPVGHVEVALGVDRQVLRHVEAGARDRAVDHIGGAVAGERRHDPAQGDLANAVVLLVRQDDVAVAVDHDAVRVVEPGVVALAVLEGGAAVAARERGDRPVGWIVEADVAAVQVRQDHPPIGQQGHAARGADVGPLEGEGRGVGVHPPQRPVLGVGQHAIDVVVGLDEQLIVVEGEDAERSPELGHVDQRADRAREGRLADGAVLEVADVDMPVTLVVHVEREVDRVVEASARPDAVDEPRRAGARERGDGHPVDGDRDVGRVFATLREALAPGDDATAAAVASGPLPTAASGTPALRTVAAAALGTVAAAALSRRARAAAAVGRVGSFAARPVAAAAASERARGQEEPRRRPPPNPC